MNYKYGHFSTEQIAECKEKIRKSIFFLLLIVDPKTKGEYEDIDVESVFDNLMHRIGGMNELFQEPVEIVTIQSLLQSAVIEYKSPNFCYKTYRKLILDAGSEVSKIKEGD